MDAFFSIFSRSKKLAVPKKVDPPAPEQLGPSAFTLFEQWRSLYAGEAYPGGFGEELRITDKDGYLDYYKLRNRSVQLFTENKYALGLISRLITNIINEGLWLQAEPEASLLGLEPDAARDWSRSTETLFALYCGDRELVDFAHEHDFYGLQEDILLSAYLSGDALCMAYVSPETGLPQLRVIDGRDIVNPPLLQSNARIVHGVELGTGDVHIAYYVQQEDGAVVRVPARNEFGDRVAWLVCAGRKRVSQVRGVPLLAAVMQALADLNRYADSELRSAWVNSLFAAFVERDIEAVPSNNIIGNTARRQATETETNSDGSTQTTHYSWQRPGMIVQGLNPGEKIKSFDTMRPNLNFDTFRKAILAGIAWANEVPPEVLEMQFGTSYSAGRQASNEFAMFLRTARSRFSKQALSPFYVLWLALAVMGGKVSAAGFLKAFRNPRSWDVRNAWLKSTWIGVVRPAIDPAKQANAYKTLIEQKLASRERLAADEFGGDWYDEFSRITAEQKTIDEAMPTPEPAVQQQGEQQQTEPQQQDGGASNVRPFRGAS